MKKIILLMFLILLIPSVSAVNGHLTLLTVSENGDNTTVGGTADLFLEIKPGSGRIFIDSFPLTKVDTQISTRFAKDVACDFLDVDCSNKDFFYTIRAKAPIVGGPSAGGAITILTISLLDGINLDESTVMTGTINAGGLIGPVAGIEEKATAAKDKGFTKILVPKWSVISEKNSSNETELITTYADSLEVEGIELVPVSTLEEALEGFTGKEYKIPEKEIEIPQKYQDIMSRVADTLCSRYRDIKKEVPKDVLVEFNVTVNHSDDSWEKAQDSINSNDYYSAASYCFTSNTRMRAIQFSNYTNQSIMKIKTETEAKVNAMILALDSQELKSMSDLETYIIVKERLYETRNLLKEEDAMENLGYIYERMYSAVAWSEFFDYNENPVVLNDEYLENACLAKIAEADERQSYVELLFGRPLAENDELSEVKQIYQEGDYAFCLFRASKIKADANAVLSSQGLTFEKIPELVDDQLTLAKGQINRQGTKFPILGYSYYNYANSLKEDNPVLASLFSGYSNEFSNLDMYFPSNKGGSVDLTNIVSFELILGFALGVLVSIVVLLFGKKK